MAEEEVAAFRAEWSIDPAAPVSVVNQFIVQIGMAATDSPTDGSVYLTLGHVSPPILLGDQDAQRAKAAELNWQLPVVALTRVQMTLARARELAALLRTQVELAEKAMSDVAKTPGPPE